MNWTQHERFNRFTDRSMGLILAGVALTNVSSFDTTPVPLPKTRIVAMGDSYSSGHNNGDVFAKYEDCFVHDVSYAHQVAEMIGATANFKNAACSGATIDEIIEGKFDQSSQLDQIDETIDYVLLTAGGNEVDLTELLQTCMNIGCTTEQEAVRLTLETVASDEFKQQLTDLYVKIAQKASSGHVMVVEYPDIIDTKQRWWCGPIIEQFSDLNYEMASFVEVFIDNMNSSIAEAVAEAKAQGYQVNIVKQTTNTDICQPFSLNLVSDPSIIVDPSEPRAVGHPTEKGHQAMAKDVLKTIMKLENEKSYNQSMAVYVQRGK